ncbi:MAG: hypothetical protein AB7Q97_07685 [Gammaproteobacteria bacterium]
MIATPGVIELADGGPRVRRVMHVEHGHVGNLKLIGGRWKFKAVGYGADGAVHPGGGPFTHRHDAIVDAPDAALVERALLG